MSKKEGKKFRRRRKRLHERGLHDDIRYRGPISYQGFMALGWLCIVMSVVVIVMKLGVKANPEKMSHLNQLGDALGYLPALSVPFMLIANFSRLLNNEEGYKAQIMRNGLATAGIFVGFNAFFYHYIIGVLTKISAEPGQVMPMVMDLVTMFTHYGFLCFNIFIDLFLCTLFMFFLNYRPQRVFRGKWIILFRLFAILPVAYEVGSILIKAACADGRVTLPVWSFPLLTVKPPVTFFVFVLMVLFLKSRELRYCRHGNTHEDYEAFLKTNRNSLHFSIYLTVMLIIAGIVDAIIMIYMMIKQAGSVEALEKLMETADEYYPLAVAVGFGKSIPLMFIAPLMLLYSYTRKPKLEKVTTLIPVAGIALIAIVVIQGGYQVLCVANLPRINYVEVKETLQEIVLLMMEMQ